MNRFLIVDGSNLLFQMFFGMPARIVNNQGKAIQGTLGFVGALLKIIRKIQPTHIVVLFDGEHENRRLELDSDYKANRVDYSEVPEEENPFSQLPDVYEALDFMGIKHAETTTCETDDWIAGYVLSSGQQTEVIISSLDSDFFQLITDRVSVLRYRGEKTAICTPEYIKEKFGINPEQYADFKSLTGDKADNIKGADKVGLKTAALLLNEFGTLENIIANVDNINKPIIKNSENVKQSVIKNGKNIKESIIRNSERLRTNYKIIRLGNNFSENDELPFELCELAYNYTGITTSEVLKGIGLR